MIKGTKITITVEDDKAIRTIVIPKAREVNFEYSDRSYGATPTETSFILRGDASFDKELRRAVATTIELKEESDR